MFSTVVPCSRHRSKRTDCSKIIHFLGPKRPFSRQSLRYYPTRSFVGKSTKSTKFFQLPTNSALALTLGNWFDWLSQSYCISMVSVNFRTQGEEFCTDCISFTSSLRPVYTFRKKILNRQCYWSNTNESGEAYVNLRSPRFLCRLIFAKCVKKTRQMYGNTNRSFASRLYE